MFIAAHAASGALIANQVDNYWLVIFLSFVSHFVLDIIPHGDYHRVHDYFHGEKQLTRKLYNVILIDSISTVILATILLSYTEIDKTLLALGIISAILPDMLVGIHESWKKSKLTWFNKMHFKVHNALAKSITMRPWPGAIGQFILIIAMLAIIY